MNKELLKNFYLNLIWSCFFFVLLKNGSAQSGSEKSEECVVKSILASCPFPKDVFCDAYLPGTDGCGQCVTIYDARSKCRDRRWEALCREDNVLACKDTGNCVFIHWIGDGDNDCADFTDEDICELKKRRHLLTGVPHDLFCDDNADCEFTVLSPYRSETSCTCKPGYSGDGKTCFPIHTTPSTPRPTTTTTRPTTTTPSYTCNTQRQQNTNYVGNDIPGGTFPASSFEECCDKCDEHDRYPPPCRSKKEENVNFEFNDIQAGGQRAGVRSFEDCCRLCKDHPECKVFVWMKEGGRPSNYCWLKTAAENRKQSPGMYAGTLI